MNSDVIWNDDLKLPRKCWSQWRKIVHSGAIWNQWSTTFLLGELGEIWQWVPPTMLFKDHVQLAGHRDIITDYIHPFAVTTVCYFNYRYSLGQPVMTFMTPYILSYRLHLVADDNNGLYISCIVGFLHIMIYRQQ